jgi:UDP-glucose 4-epimerase
VRGVRIVVTGGAGFIGYHLTKALKKLGHDVLVYDNMSSNGTERIYAVHGVELVEADVLDRGKLKEACTDADAIYHLAAQVSVPYSMEEPSADFDLNLKGTINVLEVAKKVGARVLFTSSAAVYGNPSFTPVPENHTTCPISFYGLSKKSAELYCAMYNDTFELPVTVFRLFNAYGPHCHGVVHDVLTRLSENLNHLRLLGKPDASKDFVYVADVIDAMIAPLKTSESGKDCVETFNIGSGTPSTIGFLTSLICEIIGARPAVTFSGWSWAGDVTDGLCADTSKIYSLSGWKPKTSLREGLARTVQWFRLVAGGKQTLPPLEM